MGHLIPSDHVNDRQVVTCCVRPARQSGDDPLPVAGATGPSSHITSSHMRLWMEMPQEKSGQSRGHRHGGCPWHAQEETPELGRAGKGLTWGIGQVEERPEVLMSLRSCSPVRASWALGPYDRSQGYEGRIAPVPSVTRRTSLTLPSICINLKKKKRADLDGFSGFSTGFK